MNLKKYIPEGHIYQNLAQARQIGVVNAIFNAGELKVSELRKQNEMKPQLCDDDCTKDMRYKSGMIAGILWVIDLPGEAQKIIDQLPES